LIIKHKLLLFTLILLILSSFIVTGGCTIITGEDKSTLPPEQQIYDITTDKAYDLIQENAGNPDFVILDVRTPEEYDGGYIVGALNIDYYSEDFSAQLETLDKDKAYLIYCRTARRSSSARDMMAELGFKEVYNMSGGITEWEVKGLPVVR
jgi:rhodanese-related sulfurtransferase